MTLEGYMPRYLYVRASVNGDEGFESINFWSTFVDVVSEGAAYDAGHSVFKVEKPLYQDRTANDYVVQVS